MAIVRVAGGYRSTVPGTPRNLSTTPGDAQVTLTWDPPTSNGGAIIDNYTVKCVELPEGSNTQSTNDGHVYSLDFTGLTNGESYTFQVSAHNAVGNGPYSAPTDPPVVPVLPIPAPDAPTNLSAWPGDEGLTVLLTYGSNGGSAITGCEYTLDGGLTYGSATLGSFLRVPAASLQSLTPPASLISRN